MNKYVSVKNIVTNAASIHFCCVSDGVPATIRYQLFRFPTAPNSPTCQRIRVRNNDKTNPDPTKLPDDVTTKKLTNA